MKWESYDFKPWEVQFFGVILSEIATKWFDKVFISSKYKIKKPNKAFYKLCINSFNEYADIYMVDDNILNLDISDLGIKGILYKSNEDLFEKL